MWTLRLPVAALPAFLWGAAPAPAAERAPRVLLLSPYNITFPSDVQIGEALRKRLEARAAQSRPVFFVEFLDLGRFPGGDHQARTARFLAEKYAGTPPDVIVTSSPPGLMFALKHRQEIAPHAAVVFSSVSAATLANLNPPVDVTGVTSEFDLAKALVLARRLQPDARDVVVISGASPFDQRWRRTAERQLKPYEAELKIRHLSGLRRARLLDELRRLDRNTIVLYTVMYVDGAGQTFIPWELATELAEASSAPVYGPFDSYIGRGVVGGFVEPFESIGVAAAEVVERILSGVKPETIPRRPSNRGVDKIDARAMERWGLPMSNVPPGTTVLFAKPSLWEQHRTAVLGVIGAFLAQSAFVAYLLVQIRRRHAAEQSLEQSEQQVTITRNELESVRYQYRSALNEVGERLLALQEEERKRIALELHDSTAQHLAAVGLLLMRLRQTTAGIEGSAAAIETIEASLNEAHKELRVFTYVLYPPDLRKEGLKTTLDRFLSGFASRTGIALRASVSESVDGAPYEVQRSILRIVQEALSNVHRHAGARSVAVRLTIKSDRLGLRVADDGRGFATGGRTGGQARHGLGIQGMEARVRQFGGDFKVYSGRRGTLVLATIPLGRTETPVETTQMMLPPLREVAEAAGVS